MLKGSILTLAAASLLISPLAFAEDEKSERPLMQRMAEHLTAMFEALDANGNGEVTLDEILAHKDARISEIDANGDGTIDADDLIAHHQAQMKKHMEQMLQHMDADGDGVVSVEEFNPRQAHAMGRAGRAHRSGMSGGRKSGMHSGMMGGGMGRGMDGDPEKMFARLDTNEDGVLTLDEFKMGAAMAMTHRGGEARERMQHERKERHQDRNSDSDEN